MAFNNIREILTLNTTKNKKLQLIEKLINDFEIPLSTQDLNIAFAKITKYLYRFPTRQQTINNLNQKLQPSCSYTELQEITFLLHATLTDHKDMFLAIIHAINNNFPVLLLNLLVSGHKQTMRFGVYDNTNYDTVLELLNYHSFNVHKLSYENEEIKNSFLVKAGDKMCRYKKPAIKKVTN